MENSKRTPGFPKILVFLFIIVTIIIIVSGITYYNSQKDEIRKEKYDELAAIASLKVKQIENWRHERIGDGAVIAEDNEIFANAVKEYSKNPKDTILSRKIYNRLHITLVNFQYTSIYLLDANEKLLMSISDTAKVISKETASYFRESANGKKVILSNIYSCDKCNSLHLDVIAPIFDKETLIGGLIFRIDPNLFLFPLIQSWPIPSKSSESLLITKIGNEMVFINELRHKKNTVLSLRIDIDSANIHIPAVASAFGKEGFMEGIDYRSVPVLSDIRKIPDSPWILIAKTDLDEVYAPIREKARNIGLFTALLLLFFCSGLFYVWNSAKKSLKIKDIQDKLERNALLKHYDYIIKYGNDINLLIDKGLKIVDANEKASNTYGYTKEELTGMNVKTLRSDEWTANIDDKLEEVEKYESILYETNHKRKDGTTFPVDVSLHIIEIEGKNYYQAVIRDISERKKNELELIKSEERYRSLFDNMLEGFAFCKMDFDGDNPIDFQYIKVNDVFEKLTGLKDVEGKMVSEIIPGIRESDDNLIKIYGKVSLTGTPERFEIYVEALKDWYDISVYSPMQGYFVAVFDVITKRKETEAALMISENKFRGLFNNSILGIYITTPDGRILESNRALIEMLGYASFEELKERNLEEYGFEPNYSRHEFQKRIRKEGEIRGLETAWKKKDGTLIYLRENAKIIKDDVTGEILFYEGTIEDITDRKIIEEELHISEKKYKRLYHSMMDGFVLVNMKGTIIESNESFCQMLGYSLEEIKKLTYFDLTPEKWHEYENNIVNEQVLKRSYSDVYEKEYIRKDGSIFPIEIRTFLLQNESGDSEGLWAIIRDITERKKAEEIIIDSGKKLREAQELAHLGYWDWDVKTGKVEWSEEVFKIFRLDPKVFIPQIDSILSLSPWPEENKRDRELIERATANKEPGFYEQKFLRSDGSIGYYSSTYHGKYNGKGELVSIIGTIIDITEAKKAEEAIKKLNEELEQRVVQRTTQLEAANKELEAFSYSVSHDLRAPLRALDGFAKILIEEYSNFLDEEGVRYLKIITESAANMGHLIDDLLAFSRLSRQEIKSSRINMREMAELVYKELTASASNKNIEFILHDIPEVYGDTSMIRQVWRNLIGNSIKFTTPKQNRIIEVGYIRKNNETYYFVKDNGVGFNMAYADKLFGVFQRLHSSNEFDGTGVGLAIVQRIVHRFGGSVKAEGKVNEGAQFYFSLNNNN